MPNDDQTSATKGDLKALEIRMDSKLETLRNETKQEFAGMRSMMLDLFKQHEELLHHRMTVLVEDLTHNFQGIFNDRTEQHTDKLTQHDQEIRRIKAHIGMAV